MCFLLRRDVSTWDLWLSLGPEHRRGHNYYHSRLEVSYSRETPQKANLWKTQHELDQNDQNNHSRTRIGFASQEPFDRGCTWPKSFFWTMRKSIPLHNCRNQHVYQIKLKEASQANVFVCFFCFFLWENIWAFPMQSTAELLNSFLIGFGLCVSGGEANKVGFRNSTGHWIQKLLRFRNCTLDSETTREIQKLFRRIQKLLRRIQKLFCWIQKLFRRIQKLFRRIQKLLLRIQKLWGFRNYSMVQSHAV